MAFKQAELALEMELALRGYVGNTIRPEYTKQVPADIFCPETQSTSFVARQVFQKVNEKAAFADYRLTFAAENPRNIKNKAKPEDLELIQYFRDNPSQKRLRRKIKVDGRDYAGQFNARRSKASCLRCHGKPDDAPKSLLERYGRKNGFGWKVGDVVGLDVVALPLDQTHAAVASMATKQALFTLFGGSLLCALAIFTLRKLIILRLDIALDTLSAVAQGDLRSKHIESNENDEMNSLLRGLETMKSGLQSLISSIESQSQELSSATATLTEESKALADAANDLNGHTQVVVSSTEENAVNIATIAENSKEVNGLMSELSTGSDEISTQISSIAISTEQASASVSMVAEANERMSTTTKSASKAISNVSSSLTIINEAVADLVSTLAHVSQSCHTARNTSQQCSSQSSVGGNVMRKLQDSSAKIGQVVDVIHDIADQTNMLALNATIEAARAGEAGKGFAVVAKEIKELARQTGEATKQIATQIEEMQEDCIRAVASIGEIEASVQANEGIVSEIAKRVDHHGSVAQDIALNISEAARSAEEAAVSSSTIEKTALEIAQNSHEAATGGQTIARQCADLSTAASSFSSTVTKATTGVNDIVRSNGEMRSGMDYVAETAGRLRSIATGSTNLSESLAKQAKGLAAISSAINQVLGCFRTKQ